MKGISANLLGACAVVMTLIFGLAGQAAADDHGHRVIVTSDHPRGWSTGDTRPGGTVTFVADDDAPSGRGALRLTTDSTTAAKAQYLHAANTPLANVVELSYHTKQNSAAFAGGDPSYQLIVFLNGTSGFTTLVFEPYENIAQGSVVPNAWQRWDVAQGQFWSTRSVTCSGGTVTAGAGGAPFYTLAQIDALCPSAVAIGFGVNIGTNNPGYDVEADLLNFNGTRYDFEPARGCAAISTDDTGDHASASGCDAAEHETHDSDNGED